MQGVREHPPTTAPVWIPGRDIGATNHAEICTRTMATPGGLAVGDERIRLGDLLR